MRLSNTPHASVIVIAAVAIAISAGGCREKKNDAIDPSTVAIVNGEIISRDEFDKELQRNLASLDAVDPRAPEQIEPMRRALLDELVDQRLLLQAAAKLN